MAAGSPPDDGQLGKLRKLTEVSRALTDERPLDEVMELTVRRAAEILEARRAVLLVADDHGALIMRAAVGIDDELREQFEEPLRETTLTRLEALFGGGLASFLAVPLVVGGHIRGILAVGRDGGRPPTGENEWLLSALADQVAVALEKARLNDTARIREQLIGIVGHDLKNPLTAILMAAHTLLRSQAMSELHTHLVKRIASSAGRMSDIIAHLLDYTLSRMGGGIPIEPERLAAEAFCRQAVDELALAHPKADLRLEVDSRAEGNWDRERLAQVMSNLVGNALQHGRTDRPITVRVRDDGPDCFIDVHNEGQPIPAEALPYIFEPFRHGSSGARSGRMSVGLGLYIAREIAVAHGGSIGVVSGEPGTTFTLRLPLLPPDAAVRPLPA